MATAYEATGALEKGAAALQEALQAQPGFTPAVLLQVRLKLRAGDALDALQMLDELLESDAKLVEAWRLKGDVVLGSSKSGAAGAKGLNLALAWRLTATPRRVRRKTRRLICSPRTMKCACVWPSCIWPQATRARLGLSCSARPRPSSSTVVKPRCSSCCARFELIFARLGRFQPAHHLLGQQRAAEQLQVVHAVTDQLL